MYNSVVKLLTTAEYFVGMYMILLDFLSKEVRIFHMLECLKIGLALEGLRG